MGVLYRSSFTGPDGALPSEWVSIGSPGGTVGNQYAPAATDSLDYVNTISPSADCYVEITASAVIASTSYGGIILRVVGANFYGLTWNTSGLRIQRFDGGVATNIDGGSLTAPTNGQRIRLEARGSTFRAFYGGTLLGVATDATYSAAGKSGILARGTTVREDDIEIGDFNPYGYSGAFAKRRTFRPRPYAPGNTR